MSKLFELTYGGSWHEEMIDKIEERGFNLQRMFDVMLGFTRKDDYLPARFYKELLKAGPPKDIAMDEYRKITGL